MPDAITIDSFPIETSVQWAESQEYLERKYIDDTKYILYQTDISVTEPKYDHLVLLFEQNKKAPTWASFSPPINFYKQSARFFHKNLLPGVDPLPLIERYHEEIEKIQAIQLNIPPEASERLLGFLEALEFLNGLLLEIRSKILQYRKG